MNSTENYEENKMYKECVQLQLDEVDMLSSIYCNPGEFVLYDASVISDFNDFINNSISCLRSKLDYGILLTIANNEKLQVQIELPHLYPLMENAIITIRSVLFSKHIESCIKNEIEEYISTMPKTDTYVFQVITWINENIDKLMQLDSDKYSIATRENSNKDVKNVFERLWIYSHHIKSSTKRQEIVRNARDFKLTGFMRPGKPGVICVEGEQTYTQEFWKIIKSMKWQKITIRKSEIKTKSLDEFDNLRRWTDFKEEMFTDIGDEIGDQKMNMSLFLKYLELHNSGYIKKDLFGLE